MVDLTTFAGLFCLLLHAGRYTDFLKHPDIMASVDVVPPTASDLDLGSKVLLRVSLTHAKPPIWRDLVMRSDSCLFELHAAIQGAFGWSGAHLHEFDVHRKHGHYNSEENRRLEKLFRGAKKHLTLLSTIIDRGIVKFTYNYDLGASWRHTIEIKSVEPFASANDKSNYALPVCVKGRRNHGPEDYNPDFDISDEDDSPFDRLLANQRIQKIMPSPTELASFLSKKATEPLLASIDDYLSDENIDSSQGSPASMAGVLNTQDKNVAPKRSASAVASSDAAEPIDSMKSGNEQPTKRSRPT